MLTFTRESESGPAGAKDELTKLTEAPSVLPKSLLGLDVRSVCVVEPNGRQFFRRLAIEKNGILLSMLSVGGQFQQVWYDCTDGLRIDPGLPKVLELANQINYAASATTSEQRTKASSGIAEGVKAALAHGFKQVIAPDGTKAIEVKITRPDGEEVTCLLSEGARGKWYRELADYGREQLKGATLLSPADFEAVVDSLYNAIKGLRVANGALQTVDAALKQAYQIATEGVRRHGRFSRVVFDPDERGAVAGCRVHDRADVWYHGVGHRLFCALFGASPAELKTT